jgi:hypothetical protein
MKISRYPSPSPEDLARKAEGLHELAQHIAQEHDLSFADQAAAHPGPEELVRQFGRP